MAAIEFDRSLDFTEPFLIEGLPGVGLVGKIATDHLVDDLDLEYLGNVTCDGLPKIAVYDEDSRAVHPPVRLYGDPSHDLIALQSDIPVSRDLSPDFARTVTEWVSEIGAVPLYLSGLPKENQDPEQVPSLFGIATEREDDLLEKHEISTPLERGAIGGPTGALIDSARSEGVNAYGLVVESDPQFPDPAAARQLITKGIEPLTGVSIDTKNLVDRAEEIREQKERLAKRMKEAGEAESTQAQPLRMFQ